MKKIISMTAVAALVVSAASADIKINMNARERPSLYTRTTTYAETSTTGIGCDFSDDGHNDDFTFKVSEGVAGVVAKVTLKNGDKVNTSKNAKNHQESYGTMAFDISQSVKLSSEYYGYVGFGRFKLTGGIHDDRFVNRYNKGTLADSDTAKYGLSNYIVTGVKDSASAKAAVATVGKTFLYDFNNPGNIAGTRRLGMIGEYAFGTIGIGKLTAKASALANQYSTTDYDEHEYVGAGFAAEVDYAADEFALQAIFKNSTEHTFGFGLYGDLKAVKNLNFTLGFTGGISQDYEYESSAGTTTAVSGWKAFAIDMRAFYKITKPLLVGIQAKYSSYTPDDADAETAFETVLFGEYLVNAKLKTRFEGGLFLTDLDDNDGYDMGETYMVLRPEVEYIFVKNATLAVAFKWHETFADSDASDWKTAKVTARKITVPVTFRVKL